MNMENVIQSRTVSQQRRNKYVFSPFLNTESDEADVKISEQDQDAGNSRVAECRSHTLPKNAISDASGHRGSTPMLPVDLQGATS